MGDGLAADGAEFSLEGSDDGVNACGHLGIFQGPTSMLQGDAKSEAAPPGRESIAGVDVKQTEIGQQFTRRRARAVQHRRRRHVRIEFDGNVAPYGRKP